MARSRRAAELLRQARIDVRVGQNEKRVLWHKLARIAPLAAASAASGKTVGELRGDPEWRPRLESAIAEACEVAEADGVWLRASAQWAIIDEMADETTPRRRATSPPGGARSSMRSSAACCARRTRLGVPCPALTELAGAAGLE